MDEAAAKLRTEIDSMPADLDEILRRIMQLEIEREALEEGIRRRLQGSAEEDRERNGRSEIRVGRAQSPMAGRKRRRATAARRCASRLEQIKIEIEKAERQYDLNKAAELKYGKLTELERKLKAEETRLAEKQSGKRLLKEEVDEEDIAEVVSRWTGVPVSKLLEGEMQKLLHLEDELAQARNRAGRSGASGGGSGDARPLGVEGS